MFYIIQHPVYLWFKQPQQIEELTLSQRVFYSDYTEINGHPQACQNSEPWPSDVDLSSGACGNWNASLFPK